MTALDYLDRIDPQVHLEQWYKRLSDSLDRHLKPKLPRGIDSPISRTR